MEKGRSPTSKSCAGLKVPVPSPNEIDTLPPKTLAVARSVAAVNRPRLWQAPRAVALQVVRPAHGLEPFELFRKLRLSLRVGLGVPLGTFHLPGRVKVVTRIQPALEPDGSFRFVRSARFYATFRLVLHAIYSLSITYKHPWVGVSHPFSSPP